MGKFNFITLTRFYYKTKLVAHNKIIQDKLLVIYILLLLVKEEKYSLDSF